MNFLSAGALVVLLATAIAAAVEWVEALTIVLAVGLFKGWKSALVGMFMGIGVLLAIVLFFVFLGSAATQAVPLPLARFLVGIFLLLFGIRWLHKAMLRSAGLVALRDENQEFEELHHELGEGGAAAAAIDWRGVSTAFNGVLLEGLEVVFIVIAVAGANNLVPASVGALFSLVIVVIVGAFLHRPLAMVPENLMKYIVGVMLTAFGTFFAGEGLGIEWWHADLVLLPLIGGYAIVSVILVWALRRSPRVGGEPSRAGKILRAIGEEVWGLFVGDGPLAIATVAAIAVIGVIVAHWQGSTQAAGVLLAAAVVIALMIGLGEAFTQMRHRRDKIGRYATAHPETAGAPDGSAGVAAVPSPQRGA